MIRLFALLPLITFGMYWLYLKHNGWTIQQGKKGFILIFWLNVCVLSFFVIMYFLTRVD